MNSYTLKDIHIGMKESFTYEITLDMEDSFRHITGDINPLHRDDEFASKYFGSGHVTFGMLTASMFSTLAGMYLPGKFSLIHSVEISFMKPVYVGDVLRYTGVVSEVREALKLIELKVAVTRETTNETVCKSKMKVLLLEQEEIQQ
ncbi:MAG: hypothetical protein IJP91_02805 [Synergistaceae bacterium]|nr:hypothetical protein [Synergistaceae bacterium]